MKTMCKRTLAWLVCALMLYGMLPATTAFAAVYSGECGVNGDNVTWTLDTGTGELTISGTGEMKDYPDGVSPWEHSSLVKTIVVGNGVTSIGRRAFFDCYNLTNITFPNGLTRIGEEAFRFCVKLTDFTLPNSVKSIGAGAFLGCCGLTSLELPESVTEIGDWAFTDCYGLTYMALPRSITAIRRGIFVGCDLAFVHIPSSVTSIENIDGLSPFNQWQGFARPCICSDTADCYAKTYAKMNSMEFRVCDGKHQHPISHHSQSMPEVKATCADGTFDGETYLRVSQGNSRDPLAEFGISIKGFATVQQLYYIHVQNEHGAYVQPNAGHTVTVYLPLILDDYGYPYPLEKYGVYHIDSETGQVESFRAKNHNLRIEGGYLVFEVSRFSPFIVTVEEDVPTIKMQDTKKTLPYGEKRTLTADVGNLPDGAKIVWTADSDRVTLTPSADGKTCAVSAKKNGKVTVSATVVGKDGKEIQQDGETVSVSVTLQTKANFFHKLWYWLFRIPWPFG